MTTNLVMSDEDEASDKLSHQALAFFLHMIIGLGAWFALMLLGYAIQPSVPQTFILSASFIVPAAVGFLYLRARPEPMAGHIWLAGLIWLMIISLWIVDMPTGPNACNDCGATDKITRTLFSFPRPSGLIDDNGPFICTWPAAALIGYSIGARLGMRRKESSD
jgi:hypothetical protein